MDMYFDIAGRQVHLVCTTVNEISNEGNLQKIEILSNGLLHSSIAPQIPIQYLTSEFS